ncbi:beta-L-arabinofuranosidase domain-containing protein [Brevundimonas sp.]|uniref:beta-L-arabinofuranosidase domain-containing protein n=1 Tax=Brevundimonas sp. TaxID=1871086 RepID=UPI003526D675
MTRIQAAHGDGYVGGATLWGQTGAVDGKRVFEQLRRGEIRVTPFGLNDGWVPIYAWHKVHAGLLAAHDLAGTPGALGVKVGMADGGTPSCRSTCPCPRTRRPPSSPCGPRAEIW